VQVLSLQRARPVASVGTEEALGEWHCGGRYRGWWLLRMGRKGSQVSSQKQLAALGQS